MADLSASDPGSALSCTDRLDPAGRVVRGRRAILEAVVRRWITPRGRLGYNQNYGFCVADYLNDDVTPRDLAVVRSGMIAQAMQDERVLSCTIAITVPPGGAGAYTFLGVLEDAQGPFDATFELDAAGVLKIASFDEAP